MEPAVSFHPPVLSFSQIGRLCHEAESASDAAMISCRVGPGFDSPPDRSSLHRRGSFTRSATLPAGASGGHSAEWARLFRSRPCPGPFCGQFLFPRARGAQARCTGLNVSGGCPQRSYDLALGRVLPQAGQMLQVLDDPPQEFQPSLKVAYESGVRHCSRHQRADSILGEPSPSRQWREGTVSLWPVVYRESV